MNPEIAILKARARGESSADGGFEELHRHYAPVVRAWFTVRASAEAVEDLSDVWTVFYPRWRRWQFSPEMESPEARPVLAFLMRTCQFVLLGYRRRQAARRGESIEERDVADGASGPESTHRRMEVGRLLDLAHALCPPRELDILLSKLAGVSALEIARDLRVTEAVVDHGFRNAVKRLRDALQSQGLRP